MEVKSRKRKGKRLYARAQKWSCHTCLFLISREPTFELTRNCFSLPGESKNGHACRKNGCPPRVHFQATNVNAISAPSGRIGRRPTRIDTSMQSVDASCTASNNSRKLPVTMKVISSKPPLEWFFRSVFGNTGRLQWVAALCFQASCGEITRCFHLPWWFVLQKA